MRTFQVWIGGLKMYLAVILTAVLIALIYYIFKLWFKIRLRYGISGLFLLLLPNSIGIVRPLDSETFIVTLILATIGVFLLVADVVKQKQIISKE
ncbi:MAG: hypothetical protein JW746_07410 [Candidatus Krumholzibacteriota bacterium]|nr:hypothetical protein [Candidatus Krumholzibacteriota bacterium]